MEILNAASSTIQELKKLLREQNIETNTLRITANLG